MRTTRFFIALLLVLMVVATTAPGFAQDDVPKIGIVQFVPIRPMDLARQGTVDVLEAYGYIDGENIELLFYNAEGDFPTVGTIMEDLWDEDVDAIVAISTPVLQGAYNATLDLEGPPVLFNTVTSPYAAGVASAPCIHPAWVTGIQALAPYSEILALVTELVPGIQKLGYLYNNAEANSVASTEIVTAVAHEIGL